MFRQLGIAIRHILNWIGTILLRIVPFLVIRTVAAVGAWIKGAIVFESLWLVVLVAFGSMLPSHYAITVIPIITLLPIVLLAVSVLFIPNIAVGIMGVLGIAGFASPVRKNPDVRLLFKALGILIGLNLLVGIYFSLIPTSSDPGLIPLLALVAIAFCFCVKFLRPARYVLAGIIIVLTLIFIFGGRSNIKKHYDAVEAHSFSFPVAHKAPETLDPAASFPTPFQCEGVPEAEASGKTNYSKSGFTLIKISPRSDSKGIPCLQQMVTLPKAWRRWRQGFAEPRRPGCYVWIQPLGDSKVYGPFDMKTKRLEFPDNVNNPAWEVATTCEFDFWVTETQKPSPF